jgi:hypothetical protein
MFRWGKEAEYPVSQKQKQHDGEDHQAQILSRNLRRRSWIVEISLLNSKSPGKAKGKRKLARSPSYDRYTSVQTPYRIMFLMPINVPVGETDDPYFIVPLNSLVNGLVKSEAPEGIWIIQIDNWFDQKWLRFSGIGTVDF